MDSGITGVAVTGTCTVVPCVEDDGFTETSVVELARADDSESDAVAEGRIDAMEVGSAEDDWLPSCRRTAACGTAKTGDKHSRSSAR